MAGGGAGPDNRESIDRAPARVETVAPAPPTPFQKLQIPAELHEHPHAGTLVKALSLFEFGDYRGTRETLAPVLADSNAPAPVRAAAQMLVKAMGFEPGAMAVAAGCTVFFLLIVWLVY